MARYKLACPAAAFVHPVLSLNKQDVHCQIAGHMRPAEDSPCCNPDGYVRCGIWRVFKDLDESQQAQVLSQRQDKPADLSGAGMQRAA